ncbi:helix-turn-helix domain-containing protein [Acidithiobacillus ferriphilus]|nr:helix-turn-helix domain-containing protein [Acidithiobacillus ferriphilus]
MPGYLLRLTEANAYDSPGVILSLIGAADSSNWLSHIPLIVTGQDHVSSLAAIAGKEPGTLLRLTYQPTSKKSDTSKQVGQALVSSNLLALNNPAVCPKCLEEDGYHRNIWDIALYTVCHKHGIQLVDACHKCKKRLNWARPGVSTCSCRASLTDSRERPIDERELTVSRMVSECFDTGVITGHPLIKDMASLMAVLHIGYMVTHKRPWSSMELGLGDRIIDQRHGELVQAFTLFGQWPRSFQLFLKEFIGVERARYSSFGTAALMHRLGMALDRYPFKDSHSKIFQEVKQELDRFLASDAARVAPVERLPSNSGGRALVEPELAIRLLDVTEQDFHSLARNRLPAPCEDGRYTLKDIFSLKDILDRLVTIQQAGQILGISSFNVRVLLQAGVIVAFRGPSIDGYRDLLIDAKVLDQMLARFSARAALYKEDDRDGIPVSEYLKRYKNAATKKFAEVLQAALDGVVAVVRFEQESGVAGVAFDRASLFQFIRVDVPDRDALLTIDDIMRELDLYKDAVYRLMAVGLMSFQKRSINHRIPQRYVTKAELARFRKQYVLPREIAAKHGLNVTNLAERLMHAGAKPVSGPTVDKGLVYVFRRSQIEDIDMQRLLRDTVYPTRTGRPKKGEQSPRTVAESIYLDAQDVAEMLGEDVSVQKVSQLVKSGLLRPVEHAGELGNKRFFPREEVQRYLVAYRDNLGLVTLEQVPDWLGIPKRRLDVDWIKPRRLVLVKDGLGGRYAKREDLEWIKTCRERMVSTQELADLVGKTRQDIGNAIRLGRLSAISGPVIDGFSNYMFDRETGVHAFQ